MDDYIIRQFVEQIAVAFGGGQYRKDYSSDLNNIQFAISGVSASLGEIATNMESFAKKTLETESIRLLQEENAELTAAVSESNRRHTKVLHLLRDLSSPCIGCKKEAWKPHNADCEWAASAEQLTEILRANKDNTRTAQGADSSVHKAAAG